MKALILVAAAALALAACTSDEPAPIEVDNAVVVNEDEGNVAEIVLDHCGDPVPAGQRPKHPKLPCN